MYNSLPIGPLPSTQLQQSGQENKVQGIGLTGGAT
jgi:hypothetical protein